MLSAVQIKSAKPKTNPYKLADNGGLFLLVQPNGAKLWRYKFRIGGVEGLDALGAFPEVGLAEARLAHMESRRLVSDGINPVLARREKKQALVLAQLSRDKGAFATVAADWAAATAVGLRPATIRQAPARSTTTCCRGSGIARSTISVGWKLPPCSRTSRSAPRKSHATFAITCGEFSSTRSIQG